MRNFKKLLSVLLALAMLVGITAPSVVRAQELSLRTRQVKADKELSKELEFYFNVIGHIDTNGNYVINNVSPLIERVNSGDIVAKALFEAYIEKLYRSPYDFGKCILKDYFGVYIDLVQGKLWDSFVGYLQSEAWTEAAKIVLKIIGKSASKANLIATAGQLALAAFNCRGEW